MIFFRELRQKRMIQGKFKKYLTYAIGEILLIMIGISLAFQLDNWNEDRIRRNSEIQYYKNIKGQILDDKDLINNQKEFNLRYMEQFEFANHIIEANDKSKIDTLGFIIKNMTQYSDFDRQANIYETLVNSGEIKILRNQNIIEEIRELEQKYHYINRMESLHYDAMINHIVKSVNPLFKFDTAEVMKPEAVFSFEFQNLFIILLLIMEEKDEVYQQALDQINMLKTLIEKELGSSSHMD